MTKIQAMKKVKEMIKGDGKWLAVKCERLLKSGAINIEDYGDDYRLPKILLYAALEDLVMEREPKGEDDYKAAKNLGYF